jgi:hypothetical protein
MDESSMMKNRKSRRAPVLLAATLEVAGQEVPVKLRNLSEQGALVESDQLPLEGTGIVFQRKELRVPSRLVWVQGRYAGVSFDHPLKPEEVLRNVPKPKAQAPAAKGEFKRPGLACRPLSEYERRMLERWMTDSSYGALGD